MSVQPKPESDYTHALAAQMAALNLPPTCYARLAPLLRQYETQARALGETRQALQREVAAVERAHPNTRPRQW